ncbi:MAG: hypothetical protein JEY94_09925 [Melioribacteraceae bacterium]|nr:hypothetical protein [Melioribacteraceae bacterium]
MKKQNLILYSIWAITVGIILLFGQYGIVNVNHELVLGISLIIGGLLNAVFSFDEKGKVHLVISTSAFLYGIVLTSINSMEVISPSPIIPFSLLFILGSVFFILFIDNRKIKLPLYLSIVFWVCSGLIINNSNFSFLNYFLDNAFYLLYTFWPVLLIMLGFSLIFKRK